MSNANRFLSQLPGGHSLLDSEKPKEIDIHGDIPNPNLHTKLDYPRLLHRGKWEGTAENPVDKTEERKVWSAADEAEAVADGFSRDTPNPPWVNSPKAAIVHPPDPHTGVAGAARTTQFGGQQNTQHLGGDPAHQFVHQPAHQPVQNPPTVPTPSVPQTQGTQREMSEQRDPPAAAQHNEDPFRQGSSPSRGAQAKPNPGK